MSQKDMKDKDKAVITCEAFRHIFNEFVGISLNIPIYRQSYRAVGHIQR